MRKTSVPDSVAAINKEIANFFDTKDASGTMIGNHKYGVYAFYDYDGEPIYVGQTSEKIRVRVRRHLTNQRTDAVAMNVLDPFEVAEIEVWPLDLNHLSTKGEKIEYLARAEFTVFQKVLKESDLGAVLNEKDIPVSEPIELPQSTKGRIVPEPFYSQNKHPDIRIARRASTVANLARVISERSVQKGLRRTLLTQARRLERLASQRFEETGGIVELESVGEETGESNDEE